MINKIDQNTNDIKQILLDFVGWLEQFGETSYDHQSYYAGPLGKSAKDLYYKKPLVGIMAVAPMVFSEAIFPYARKFFWKKQRFPIADAHYAMGFAFLSKALDEQKYYDKAVHFLEILENTHSRGYKFLGWGYPFDWVTRGGILPAYTPFITSTPYMYEAFSYVYQIDHKDKWLRNMHAIAEHAANEIKDIHLSDDTSTCGYSPDDNKGGVINASAYRAFMLTKASVDFSENKYWQIAEKNLNFVLKSQQEDGSWFYAMDSVRDFVDHFHTCFILKALSKIELLKNHKGCRSAIERGVAYYANNLFDDNGRPKPFSRAPRLTIYKKELYDYAECINLGVLLRGRFKELDDRTNSAVNDIITRWQKPDGSFRSRKLFIGWDNVPMHRWAQSQMFRSLCFLLYNEKNPNLPIHCLLASKLPCLQASRLPST